MSFRSEFQTFESATQNARLAVSNARTRHREKQSVGGPQRPRRHLALWEFVDVRRNGSRQSLVRDDCYFVLDALLDSGLARTQSALLTDDDVVLSSLQPLDDCNRSVIQQRVAVVDS